MTRDNAVARAICAYNHVLEDEYMSCMGKLKTVKDKNIGISYTTAAQAVLNLIPLEILDDELSKFTNQEYLSIGNHEQYYSLIIMHISLIMPKKIIQWEKS